MTTFQASRTVREELILPYAPVMKRLIVALGGSDEATVLSDKIAAKMCDTSERQIRKARLEGMNPYLADHLCVKGLGLNPQSVFGDEWLSDESFFAAEIYDQKMTPAEARAMMQQDNVDLGVAVA